jgi:hypothetical protein
MRSALVPPSNCSDTGAANVVFLGGWDDEDVGSAVQLAGVHIDHRSALFWRPLAMTPVLEPRAAVAVLWCLFSPNPGSQCMSGAR